MQQTILDLMQENGILSMIIQNQIMMQQMKLIIIQKFKNLIFVIRTKLIF